MQPFDWLVLASATFYLSHAISKSHGPWHVFATLRERLPLGGLTTCLVCLSFWLAGAFYLLMQTSLLPLVYVFAVAGLSVLAWRYTGGEHV